MGAFMMMSAEMGRYLKEAFGYIELDHMSNAERPSLYSSRRRFHQESGGEEIMPFWRFSQGKCQ